MSLGMGSRALMHGLRRRPILWMLLAAMDGDFIPVPGGVLIQTEGVLLEAVGISGDTLKMMRQQLFLRLRRSVLSLKPGLIC